MPMAITQEFLSGRPFFSFLFLMQENAGEPNYDMYGIYIGNTTPDMLRHFLIAATGMEIDIGNTTPDTPRLNTTIRFVET